MFRVSSLPSAPESSLAFNAWKCGSKRVDDDAPAALTDAQAIVEVGVGGAGDDDAGHVRIGQGLVHRRDRRAGLRGEGLGGLGYGIDDVFQRQTGVGGGVARSIEPGNRNAAHVEHARAALDDSLQFGGFVVCQMMDDAEAIAQRGGQHPRAPRARR